MNKKYLLLLWIYLICCSLCHAEDLSGFWQTVDKKSKKPTSIIAIYPYQGKYYGKIVGTYNAQGALIETLQQPKTRAPGVAGNPYYCGLDIIWGCTFDGSGVYKGHVIDPREGKRYTAKIWKERGNLILRGELLMFGRNETLIPLPNATWSTYLSDTNLSTLTPSPYRLRQ